MATTSLIVHHPDRVGAANDVVRNMVTRILNNWQQLTPKQVSIAATVYGYSKPAEMISRKQEWNLKQAIAILDANSGEPGDD